jgi:hypothetical protein
MTTATPAQEKVPIFKKLFSRKSKNYWNSYYGGVLLGIVLLWTQPLYGLS